MIVIGPPNPLSRRASAVLAPARPPPTMTTELGAVISILLAGLRLCAVTAWTNSVVQSRIVGQHSTVGRVYGVGTCVRGLREASCTCARPRSSPRRPAGRQRVLEPIGDLLGDPLLNLWPAADRVRPLGRACSGRRSGRRGRSRRARRRRRASRWCSQSARTGIDRTSTRLGVLGVVGESGQLERSSGVRISASALHHPARGPLRASSSRSHPECGDQFRCAGRSVELACADPDAQPAA